MAVSRATRTEKPDLES